MLKIINPLCNCRVTAFKDASGVLRLFDYDGDVIELASHPYPVDRAGTNAFIVPAPTITNQDGQPAGHYRFDNEPTAMEGLGFFSMVVDVPAEHEETWLRSRWLLFDNVRLPVGYMEEVARTDTTVRFSINLVPEFDRAEAIQALADIRSGKDV